LKLVGLMTVRNEEWVLGLSLRAALLFLDEAIVLDHASTDGTPSLLGSIAAEHPGRVRLLREDDPVWREAAIRQRLLDEGRAAGATHLCMLDADEVLAGNLLPEARGLFAALAPGETLWLPWLALWRHLDAYRDDASRVAQRSMVLGFRDGPGLHYAPLRRDFDFHTRRPRGAAAERRLGRERGGVLHLAAVDGRRLRAKTAWYQMIETVRFPWRRSPGERAAVYAEDDPIDPATRPVPAAWWEPYRAWRGEVRPRGGAWYERESRRLWREHGAGLFAGLGLDFEGGREARRVPALAAAVEPAP
jgi:hypothetical protein